MSKNKISAEELKVLRNKIPIRYVLERLCNWECKEIEGYTRFQCPLCKEMNTSLHPGENLGRCFRCQKNFNPIDFTMSAQNKTFIESVKYLRREGGYFLRLP